MEGRSLGEPDHPRAPPSQSPRDTYALKASKNYRTTLFSRPALPSFLPDLRIFNLEVGTGCVDLHLTRHDEEVSIQVLRRQGTHAVVSIEE
jgi:hypothetical protein